mmetsp:Transcript_13185/g.17378  ORF Transcript_13185/g.17378 Transcript_13185/m.17378 type:complete len:229 (+) Transcript_13185:1961-2647(+)
MLSSLLRDRTTPDSKIVSIALKKVSVERCCTHSSCMKTVRRLLRDTSWYSEPKVVSRLSLVTVPYSSTPFSSGKHVILPTPHSWASSRRLKFATVAVFGTMMVVFERPQLPIGPRPSASSSMSLHLVMKELPASSLSALVDRRFSRTSKFPFCLYLRSFSSRSQYMRYVAPLRSAASISSFGMTCLKAVSAPLAHGREAEVPYSTTPPRTGTKADDWMLYSSAIFALG